MYLLTEKQEAMLICLSQSTMYAPDIRRAIADATNGAIYLQDNSLYPTLRELCEREWATSRWGDGYGARRRYYAIAPLGLQVLREKEEYRQRLKNGNV